MLGARFLEGLGMICGVLVMAGGGSCKEGKNRGRCEICPLYDVEGSGADRLPLGKEGMERHDVGVGGWFVNRRWGETGR